MNTIQLVGDLMHLLAILILLVKICKTRSCAGISGKSQILFFVVYVTRYLDLFTIFISMYHSIMKVVFIVVTGATVYVIYVQFKETNETNHDSFRIELLLIPCALLSLVVNSDFTVLEVLWTFSIYLESVAILPQLFLVSKTCEGKSIVIFYLFALGLYRALYLLKWTFQYIEQSQYYLMKIVPAVVQTIFITFTIINTKFNICRETVEDEIVKVVILPDEAEKSKFVQKTVEDEVAKVVILPDEAEKS